MTLYTSDSRLETLARDYHDQYVSNAPFPHIVIDDFFENVEALQTVVDVFPKPDDMAFYKYDNPLEKKLAFDQVSKLPAEIAKILMYMNSPSFLKFLETMTGIDGLIPDPYYRGGGIHQIQAGGKLDIHIDFNRHQKLKLDRRLNAIVYLNQDWDESYGGHLELWSGRQENGQHILDSCYNRVLPIFNRLVVFSTSEKSYHGHPDPVTCPPDRARQSIALYYYTNGRPEDEQVDAHSTTFIGRPDELGDSELAELRVKRNKGRLATNI